MTPELLTALAVLFGSGGLLGLALKRTWQDRDTAAEAWARGVEQSEARHQADMQRLRDDMAAGFTRMADHHTRDMAEAKEIHRGEMQSMSRRVGHLQAEVSRVRIGLGKIMELVPLEHSKLATQINLATLNAKEQASED